MVAIGALLCVAAFMYAAQNFALTTDTDALISAKEAWRQNGAAFDRAFPQNADTILVVVDGQTPEIAESATSRLTAALNAHPAHYKHIERPDGGPFFDKEGLLYQSTAEGKGDHGSARVRAGVSRAARRRSQPARGDDQPVDLGYRRATAPDHLPGHRQAAEGFR